MSSFARSFDNNPPLSAPVVSLFRNRSLIVSVTLLWALAIAGGWWSSLMYDTTPSPAGDARQEWPRGSSCTLSSHQPTLVMFIHPRCPCSRSSLQELSTLAARCEGRLSTHVVFLQPASVPVEWSTTDLWDRAGRIPGVTRRLDVGGLEQQRFDARTSGETFLYLPTGELAFHGGITAYRGHAGDNAGRAALESFLTTQQLPLRATPVFGCELGQCSQSFLRQDEVRANP